MNLEARKRELEKSRDKQNQRFSERHRQKQADREKREQRKALLQSRRQKAAEREAGAARTESAKVMGVPVSEKTHAPPKTGILQKLKGYLGWKN